MQQIRKTLIAALILVGAALLVWCLYNRRTETAPLQPLAIAPASSVPTTAPTAIPTAHPPAQAVAAQPTPPPAMVTPNPVLSPDWQAAATPAPQATAAPAAQAATGTAAEVEATERMYRAHAPLRTQEVADPDSESNRRALEAMVQKAMIRQTVCQ